MTCHDGFTLNDLVSYDVKHNQANGEDNRDGANDNRNWNCGVEGPSEDAVVEKLRCRQIKNFFTITLLSIGMPMIGMGDEVRRTQLGNSNAYCQDNETSWFDWALLSKHRDVHRFVTMLIERRLLRDVQPEYERESLNQLLGESNRSWHGTKLYQPDWNNWSHSVALSVELKKERQLLHLILNAYWESLEFELPPLSEERGVWRRWIDTALDSPADIVVWQSAPPYTGRTYRAGPRSMTVLYAPWGTS